MKKTFSLEHEKIKPARLVESAKHDVKKYLKRERRKTLPEGVDYWDFDCKFGLDEASATPVFTAEISKLIDGAVEAGNMQFYVEIIAKDGFFSDSED